VISKVVDVDDTEDASVVGEPRFELLDQIAV
jgi:hypothetical protein